jgi:hypothetical protein
MMTVNQTFQRHDSHGVEILRFTYSLVIPEVRACLRLAAALLMATFRQT